MTIADEARESALHCEMVKYAYRQTKDGVVVSFVVHPNDIPAELSISHIGARFMVALVQIGDDERPITRAEKESKATSGTPAKLQPDPKPTGAKPDKKPWTELNASTASAICCNDPIFRAYLNEECGFDTKNQDDAAIVVRQLCGVESRAELNTNPDAKLRWQALDDSYRAWKALEHA